MNKDDRTLKFEVAGKVIFGDKLQINGAQLLCDFVTDQASIDVTGDLTVDGGSLEANTMIGCLLSGKFSLDIKTKNSVFTFNHVTFEKDTIIDISCFNGKTILFKDCIFKKGSKVSIDGNVIEVKVLSSHFEENSRLDLLTDTIRYMTAQYNMIDDGAHLPYLSALMDQDPELNNKHADVTKDQPEIFNIQGWKLPLASLAVAAFLGLASKNKTKAIEATNDKSSRNWEIVECELQSKR